VNSKGNDEVCLITDCMRAGLMPDGTYFLGEFEVQVEEGIAKTTTGSLAGSTLKLIDGVRNLYKWSDLPLLECWHMASLNPAKSVGLDKKIGSISAGKKADFVVINEELEILTVAVEGEVKQIQEVIKCN
jgi:N-acetylglucosamine-6-phosphate deacetylase